MLENHRAVALEMLGIADRPVLAAPLEQALQRGLARDQRRIGQIAAVQIEQIEHPIDEAIAAALFQVGLQHRETRNALVVLDDQFAVEERRRRGKRGDRRGDALEAMRPIERFAGKQLDLAVIETLINLLRCGSRRI